MSLLSKACMQLRGVGIGCESSIVKQPCLSLFKARRGVKNKRRGGNVNHQAGAGTKISLGSNKRKHEMKVNHANKHRHCLGRETVGKATTSALTWITTLGSYLPQTSPQLLSPFSTTTSSGRRGIETVVLGYEEPIRMKVPSPKPDEAVSPLPPDSP